VILGTFTKVLATTTLQIIWYSHVTANLTGNSQACNFQVRVDSAPGSNPYGAIISHFGVSGGNTGFPVSTTDIFTGIPAGSHTLTLWDRAPQGATSCVDNAGNYSRTVVVMEY
jgi:hypothetical protein